MAAVFLCEVCSYVRDVPEAYQGQRVRCPQCTAAVLVSPSADAGIALAPLGQKACPFCAESIQAEARKCRFCGEIIDRALAIAKEKEKIREVERAHQILHRYLPGSRASLILGLVSLVLFPLAYFLGPVAILMGFHSLRERKAYPSLEGANFARAGIVLGVVAMVGLSFGFLFLKFLQPGS